MNTLRDRHLADDDVVVAAVERNDLSPVGREHLLSCPGCREKVEELAGNLGRMADMAREMAPHPSERLLRKRAAATRFVWLRPLPMAVATVAICLLAVVMWRVATPVGPVGTETVAMQEAAGNEWMLDGVDGLVGDSLSGTLGMISPDVSTALDEQFFEMLAPSEDEGGFYEEEENEEGSVA